jgi:iron(III) transport system substrate-binding protein
VLLRDTAACTIIEPVKRSHLLAAAALTALLGLVAAGCGGNGDEPSSGAGAGAVIEAVKGLPPAQRLAKLKQLAEKEGGQLSLYTSISGSVVEDFVSAFEDDTGVDVALHRASSEVVEQRVDEEADAGFHGADAVETGGQSLLVFAERGLLAPYPFDPAPLIEGAVHDGWAATRLQRFVVAWNTKRTTRPTSWESLGDPKYKGKIVIEPGDWDWYSRLWQYWVEEKGVSETEANARFERIARNARVVQGHSLGAELLAAGEVDVLVPGYAHHIDKLVKKGAPVAWTPAVEPVILRQNGVGILSDAKHPAAAALFAEWALSPKGQSAYAVSGYRSPRRDVKAPDGDFRAIDEEQLYRDRERWIDGWKRLVTLAKPASS